MIQIPYDKLKFYEKGSIERKTALRKISKFNFIKDKTANLFMDSSIIESANITVIDNNPYLFLRFADKETWRDTRILIGAFDVLHIEDSLGFTFIINEELTSKWRKIMLTQYPEYRAALIQILDKRKFEAYQHYQDQINELNK